MESNIPEVLRDVYQELMSAAERKEKPREEDQTGRKQPQNLEQAVKKMSDLYEGFSREINKFKEEIVFLKQELTENLGQLIHLQVGHMRKTLVEEIRKSYEKRLERSEERGDSKLKDQGPGNVQISPDSAKAAAAAAAKSPDFGQKATEKSDTSKQSLEDGQLAEDSSETGSSESEEEVGSSVDSTDSEDERLFEGVCDLQLKEPSQNIFSRRTNKAIWFQADDLKQKVDVYVTFVGEKEKGEVVDSGHSSGGGVGGGGTGSSSSSKTKKELHVVLHIN